VSDFDPAKYMVVISPLHIGGGGDNSLDALLATAGELTAIVNEGVLLHEKMVELHGYLTGIHDSLAATGVSVQALLPSDAEAEQEDAGSIMQVLLADAEAEADAMLAAFGYEAAADAAAADRMQMLSEAAADPARSEEEKARILEQLELIEDYLLVAGELKETELAIGQINASLTEVTDILPDLVYAYSYENDHLYSVIYKIYTLYQNLANYYASIGDGGSYDYAVVGDWYDVIVFTNHEGIPTP